jgi:hypothetical protein
LTLIEFSNLSPRERWKYIFTSKEASFNSFREYYNQKVTLWDCGTFFTEVYYLPADNTYTKIEGFEPDDRRLDIYIDCMNKLKDYPFENE